MQAWGNSYRGTSSTGMPLCAASPFHGNELSDALDLSDSDSIFLLLGSTHLDATRANFTKKGPAFDFRGWMIDLS